MGIMGVFKWLRKDGNEDRHRWSMSPELNRLNNEACRIKAIRAFMDRRKSENESSGYLLISSPDKEFHYKSLVKNNNQNNKVKDENCVIPGVPHIQSSEFFEIGWVSGTEDRYLEYIYAEWDNTKISLKRHSHPECQNAIKADLAVLTEIRHPNIVLLIATSHLEDYGLVSIFESLNCTLYNYVHEKGERISVQEVSRCARKLAEALGYAHMRGYIHGAISSHCVFLASGVIKLGGWELSTKKDQPKVDRDFEARLQAEIFRWLAPEIFCGLTPTEATDVYGLSLLIWEMTTMHLPWSGLSRPDVEKQYVHWERGVVIDLYNFPPLLSKLLEAGLQIDVTKRSMTMNRMRRFLQRLELQYESEAPIYADQYTNNNISPNSKTFNVPVCTSQMTKCSETPLSSDSGKPASKILFNAQKNVCNRVARPTSKKGLAAKEPAKSKLMDKRKPTLSDKKSTNLFLEEERLHNDVKDPEILCKTFTSPEQRREDAGVQTSSVQYSVIPENNSTTEDHISSTYAGSESTQTLDSFDDGDLNETRNDIKKLREALANKRERFFYGDDFQNSVIDASVEDKSAVLNRVRSKDYEPHKPASHKTSFEPKINKSYQCDTMSTKPANRQQQKSAHSCVPPEIKEAVLNPQLLSANCRNIFESSLWRKEKLICISKMRKSYTEGNMITHPQCLKPENSPIRRDSSKPIVKNHTFTINDVSDQKLEESSTFHADTLSQDNTNSENKSLVALKEALDRATDIICPSSPIVEDSRHSSPLRTFEDNCEITTEDIETREALFENLIASKISTADPNSKIKSIERSTNDEDQDQISQNTYKVKKRFSNASNSSGWRSPSVRESESSVNDLEEKESENNMTLLLFSDKNEDKGCNSCHHMTALARRRSLPAALGQLKAYSRMSIGRLPIRRGDLPDSTVEDLYIDDEFGDSLNVNMVLLENENLLEDEDILPDLLELSQHSLNIR